MSQSLARAVNYIKEPKELFQVFKRGSYTTDLIAKNVSFIGAQDVKYQSITFDSATLGTYSTANGYTAMGIVAVWKTLTLSQDKGNKLIIDKFEDEEAMATGLVTYVNRYVLDVQAVAVDTYVFGIIAAKSGVTLTTLAEALTSSTVITNLSKAFEILKNNNIEQNNLLLYCSPRFHALLNEAAFGKGLIQVGTAWGGELNSNVQVYNGAKIVEVPTSRLGSGVAFMLLHKDACPVFVKYQETEYFDKIPGYGGRRSEADVGVYYDSFVYDEAVKAVYVCKNETHTLAFADGLQTATPTSMTTLTVSEGDTIALPANTMVVSGYHFIGWDTDVSGDAVVYADCATYTMSTANATLHAVWEADA
ncbi:MAG: InlB B-repeat-containing protein [Methanoregula sp.]